MKKKFILVIIIVILLAASCDIIDNLSEEPTPYVTSSPTATNSPFDAMGITPNITEAATFSPAPAQTAATAVISTASNTPQAIAEYDIQLKQQMNSFLPPLNTTLRYYGIAETGHYGTLKLKYDDGSEAMYEFSGTYDDGMGVPDKFTVRYFFDYVRGTITEKAEYNERLNKNEFHSKLHNIVVLKFPMSLGADWSHETTIDGAKYQVSAEVIELTNDLVTVKYTAQNVPGYYDDTYIEIRTFEKGYGMTSFSKIIPGEPDLSGVDTDNEQEVEDFIMNMYMFGYSLLK